MNILPQAFLGLQEIPGEISVIYSFTGCPFRCDGCHSQELWDENNGIPFDFNWLSQSLDKYIEKASCVCFFGGEQDEETLYSAITLAWSKGFRTALYTGYDDMSWLDDDLVGMLDYIKVGHFDTLLGGLQSRSTNQRMYRRVASEWQDITEEFWRE